MARLFQDDFRYNETASGIDRDVYDQIEGVFRAYVKAGYSPRELAHIFHWTINDLELDAVLETRSHEPTTKT